MSEEKRMIGSYEVEHSIHLGDKEVILGVDKKEQYPFMVCYCTYDNPLGVPWATEAVGSDDYLEAMQIFLDRVKAQVELSKTELAKYPFDKTVFTVKDCIPDDKGKTLSARLWLSMPSRSGTNISTLPISFYWRTAETVRLAAEGRRCLEPALPQASIAGGKGTMYLGKSSPNVRPNGQRKPLPKSRHRRKRKKQRTGRNADGGTTFNTARTEIHLFPEYAT